VFSYNREEQKELVNHMKTKPLLIFDFFGVVVGEVAHTWLKQHLSQDHANRIIKDIFVQVDEGKLNESDLFALLEKESGIAADKIMDDWFDLGVLNKDTVQFILNYRNKFHIVLLSNAVKSYVDKYFALYNLASLFDKVYISSEIKMAKPNKAIFLHVVNDFPHPFSKAVMIDDSLNNVSAAKQAGLEGILFENMQKVETEIFALFDF